jgi:uncharacterized protein (DUF433 family)
MTIEEVYQYIEVTPFNGGPSVWGTRITPEHIIDDFAKGMSVDSVLKEHPELSAEHIEAAFMFSKQFPTDKQKLFIAVGHLAGSYLSHLIGDVNVDLPRLISRITDREPD